MIPEEDFTDVTLVIDYSPTPPTSPTIPSSPTSPTSPTSPVKIVKEVISCDVSPVAMFSMENFPHNHSDGYLTFVEYAIRCPRNTWIFNIATSMQVMMIRLDRAAGRGSAKSGLLLLLLHSLYPQTAL